MRFSLPKASAQVDAGSQQFDDLGPKSEVLVLLDFYIQVRVVYI
jgi:hypothetical protein